MMDNGRNSPVFAALAVSGAVMMAVMNVYDDFGLSAAAAHLSLALETAYREAGLDPDVLRQLQKGG